MYYAIVASLMFLLPLTSIVAESVVGAIPLGAPLVAKWFVFWSVGWRLLLAGIRQVYQPGYTAKEILGLKSDESLIVVRELGFANIAIGALGVLSHFQQSWQLAAAIVGGLFYGLAGINHAVQGHKSRMQGVAMVSDLFVSAVLLCSSAAMALGR